MKRIFVLEDDPIRIAWFQQRFIGFDITYAESCSQVDRFEPPYALICLDHDLGGRQLEDHEDNGERFAQLIRDRVVPAVIVVHSFNPAGAWGIVQTLRPVTPHVYPAPFRFHMFNDILDVVVGTACSA